MTNNEERLSDQVNGIIAERDHLRVKSESDDTTIHLMREQYDSLAATVASIRQKAAGDVEKARYAAEQVVTDMMIERDQAVRAFKAIDTTLMQAADLIMQALRARAGDSTPEKMPERVLPHIKDDRLPVARLSS